MAMPKSCNIDQSYVNLYKSEYNASEHHNDLLFEAFHMNYGELYEVPAQV